MSLCPFLLLLFLLHYMSTVVFSTDHGELDSGQVLLLSALHQNHVVLLQVVSLTRDKNYCLLSVRQPHPSALPVGRIGLLGLSDHRLQHHCLQLGPAKRGADRLRGSFGLSLTMHLVEGGHGPGEKGACPPRSMLGGCREGKAKITANNNRSVQP